MRGQSQEPTGKAGAEAGAGCGLERPASRGHRRGQLECTSGRERQNLNKSCVRTKKWSAKRRCLRRGGAYSEVEPV